MPAAEKAGYALLGAPAPDYFELTGSNSAAVFSKSIEAAKKANPVGASVATYSPGEYGNMKLFVTEDGKAGVAVKSDGDIVSLFNTPGGTKGVAFSALQLAVQNGGTKLDAFDTVLPILYAKAGFTPVSRLKWDDSQAPAGWNKDTFKAFNKGEPDVVFMVHDPSRNIIEGARSPYKPGEGKLVNTYDEAVKLQSKAVRERKRKDLGDQIKNVFKKGLALTWKAFNPDQPRVEAGMTGGGRWRSEGDIHAEREGRPAGTLMQSVKPVPDDQIQATVESLIDKNLSPEEAAQYRKDLAEVQRMLEVDKRTGRSQSTKHIHTKDKGGKGGYTRERLDTQNKIADRLLAAAEQAARPASGQDPTLTIVSGRGGSGKGGFEFPPIQKYDPQKNLVLDSDKLKALLAQADGRSIIDKQGNVSVGKLAPVYHDESTDLLERITRRAKEKGLNVVIDMTMKSPKDRLVRQFKKAGYKTKGYYMHVPPGTAAGRAIARSVGGRLVRPEYILTSNNNERNFDRLLVQLDEAEIYTNTGARGSTPERVYPRPTRKSLFRLLD